ncbi:MAG TPA: 4'-phosphopantetheinyl transferase superfamily protein [Prolixibacteraceae bacterium]|nr:4'-phosphopantetheinyl transferase superfamily protein [Prolixibacteraceae bacterium]
MAFVKEIKTETGSIGIWEISENVEQLQKRFNYTTAEKEEFVKLKNEKRRKEYLAVRCLLNQMRGNKEELLYFESGKPHLKNRDISLSVSHSAELVTVFISKKNAGIDTENIFRNTQKVAPRFLSDSEIQTIAKSKSPDLSRIIYWSAKEAIFKCTFRKEIQFNSQIKIHPFQVENHGHFSGQLETGHKLDFFDLEYFFYGNNVVVYCVEG